MLNKLNTAYGAGYRCGMSRPKLHLREDGTKTISEPICPYRSPLQLLQRVAWWMGYDKGLYRRLTTWCRA